MRHHPRAERDHGAAAVEFALVVPILLLLVGGILDFGFAFNAQISLTHAAREGVRVESLGTGDGAARAVDAFAAPAVDDVEATVVRACPHEDGAAVLIEATYGFLILPFGDVQLSSQAVMRCNG
jgi:hypothetical protein